jgi:hydroxyacylglutathione hydrolase
MPAALGAANRHGNLGGLNRGTVIMPAKTHLFPCLQDNYGVLLHDPTSGSTAAIDAPEAAAVEAALTATGWKLTDILVTHHHSDHTAGIPELKQRYGCRVVAPRAEAARIANTDVTVEENDTVGVGGLAGRVIDTPGHTAGHISYWFGSENLAFVGDTLFSIGCGRVIEGTPEMMWESLLKLRNLPDQTQIFCGHEYTAANIAFARSIDPNNAALVARAEEVAALRAKHKPTIPTTLGAEKAANPFLRADNPALAAAVGMSGRAPAQVFAKIRGAKDTFRG